jgi:CheY-like chemotaxis protein
MSSYVLMLETDPDDRELTEATLAEMQFSVPVKFLSNIEELDLFTAEQTPSVILISDSNRGLAVKLVKQLKADPELNHIPVVVLGERSINSYVKDCYRAGANTFITKPSSLESTRKNIKTFFTYWFEVAEL